jgi:spore coat protein CotH
MMLLVFALACSHGSGTHSVEQIGDGSVYVGDTGTEAAPGAPETTFPFGEDVIYDISLDLPPASVDGMVYQGDYVPCTFHVDGQQSDCGVRLKGSSTFDKLDKKPSLKIAFDAFTPGHRFLEMEHLTLNAMKFDKTMMREAVAYRIFEQAGVPSPRQGYASLTINGTPYGLYSVIESLDNEWLKRVLPDDKDGNLYDTQFIASDLTGAALSTFSLQEGDDATAGADLQQLVSDLDHGNILDVLQNRFDFEPTMNYLAVDLATGNYDGYSRNTNNYLLYHETVADRWIFVPWGQDTAFGGAGPLYNAVRARVTSACAADSACREILNQHVRDLLDGWDANDVLGWATDMAAIVGPACEADTRKYEKKCEQDQLLNALGARPNEIRTEIGP